MRLALLLIAALAAAAQQDQSRVLYLTHTSTEEAFQEIVTTVRGLTQIAQLSADPAQKSLTLNGTASQIALAGWLVNQLDQAQPGSSATLEYRPTDGSGDLVRLFRTANVTKPQDIWEIATVVRSVADIRYLFVCFAPKIVALRAAPARIAITEWLIREIDRPAGPQPAAAPREFTIPGSTDDVMRVFFLQHANNPRDRQEIVTTLRSIGDIQRIFVYNSPSLIAMRTSSGQAAFAAWLVDELDRPASSRDAALHEYRLSYSTMPVDHTVARVFYLSGTPAPEDIMDLATRIRKTANIQRIFVYNARKAIAARSNAEGIAIAARLVDERNAAAAR